MGINRFRLEAALNQQGQKAASNPLLLTRFKANSDPKPALKPLSILPAGGLRVFKALGCVRVWM